MHSIYQGGLPSRLNGAPHRSDKMASSPQLAIAKASLMAALLRPDPTACSRDEIEHFHVLLNSAIAQCSPDNVQVWKHTVTSP